MSSPGVLGSSLDSLTSSAATTPAINPATEPANVRAGGQKAQEAYSTALQFEQVLVNEMAQQLTASANITGDSSSTDGGSSDDSSGSSSSDLLGSGPAASEYAQLLPGTLTSSIMSNGGLGNLADTLAASLDPALNDPASASSAASSATGSSDAGATA